LWILAGDKQVIYKRVDAPSELIQSVKA